ncbi:MAG: hypothetical protein ACLRWP_12455 [Bilophila wadsworthia]
MPFWTASSPVRGCIVTPSWRHFSAFRREAVSQARRKRKIPEGWVVKVSQQCGLSMDWLMFGKETNPLL